MEKFEQEINVHKMSVSYNGLLILLSDPVGAEENSSPSLALRLLSLPVFFSSNLSRGDVEVMAVVVVLLLLIGDPAEEVDLCCSIWSRLYCSWSCFCFRRSSWWRWLSLLDPPPSWLFTLSLESPPLLSILGETMGDFEEVLGGGGGGIFVGFGGSGGCILRGDRTGEPDSVEG